MEPSELHPATIAVTVGRPERAPDQPLNPPITMAATYLATGVMEYGRYGNPTWTAFEQALGELETGRCLTYGSGLAAVDAVLNLVKAGGVVVAPRHAYSGSLMQLADLEARGRLSARLVDVTDTASVIAACQGADLVLLESPTNPALEIVDLPVVIPAARAAGAIVAIDNTFATPLRQRPLELGADIVVHSATKFIAGHSDVQLGAVITRADEIWTALKERRDLYGAIAGPFETWLALRGLRTLHVRLDRAEDNARQLVEHLSTHPLVEEVRYPGFGAIISIVIRGGASIAEAVTTSTRIWAHATSLGGVESTLERRRRWPVETLTIPEGLVRLAVGIEDAGDLWADLESALDTAAAVGG
ncbi:MAG: PLP-dependent transferase [Nocardioidaceae bacterium]|nr:MAG: PLP-dependent transferase [Nocardioidaceae bacterium]